ncbi:RNA-binding protein [bacterium]|nr:RNA-binding protein [bacterium]
MTSKLYVGNISWNATEESLKDFFGAQGTVKSAKIVTDHDTGRSKGFGFVEMGTPEEADQARESLNGAEFEERTLRVDKAQEKDKRVLR